MSKNVQSGRSIRWGAAIAVALAGAAVLGATGAAHAGNWKKHRHHHHAPGYFVPPGHVRYYAPRPVIYAPRPVVVYPQPMLYAPAYPAYYGPPGGSLSFGITVPLR